METKFNFKSAICTSREQSKRLLALGLKKETADMVLCEPFDYEKHKYSDGYVKIVLEEGDGFCKEDIPAWGLHRLLCIYGLDYEIKEVYNNAEECYGMLICAIEIAIEDGDFNKEYLNGND